MAETRKKSTMNTTRKLVFCAMAVALAAVTSNIRLYRFPFGGSVTLCSMLFCYIPAWLYGVPTGVICGLLYGLLQFVMGAYVVTVLQVLFDYFIVFAVMGLGGIFSKEANGLSKGYALAVVARWIAATIAGLIWVSLGSTAWDGWAPLPYSAAYNACYIFTEGIITLVLLRIPTVRHALERVRNMAAGI